jgi:hypothetical protein
MASVAREIGGYCIFTEVSEPNGSPVVPAVEQGGIVALIGIEPMTSSMPFRFSVVNH